jgi:formiminotetrahydrofolate cyclodeaminase
VHDQTSTIEQFLQAAGARQPTPGGGSVAALAGALASSMGEMVVNYSLGKKGLEAHGDRLSLALMEFAKARTLLARLIAEDQSAYEALTAARKLAKDSPDRPRAIADAALACIRVPQTIAATAIAILDLADRLVGIVNFHLLSDLAVCADLAMASARCAIYNVRVNLADIASTDERWQVETAANRLLSKAAMLIQTVSPKIWQRVAAGA